MSAIEIVLLLLVLAIMSPVGGLVVLWVMSTVENADNKAKNYVRRGYKY